MLFRSGTFQTLSGTGFEANYFDVDTGNQFEISGPRKHGRDRLAERAGGFVRSKHAADSKQPILTVGAFALTEPSEEY